MNDFRHKTYDLAFSLGAACSCSQTLRAAGLQYASFPFDWLGHAPFINRIDALAADFAHWMDPPDIFFVRDKPGYFNHICGNSRWGFEYHHDFPVGLPWESSLSDVQAKYRKRCGRMLSMLRQSKRVLAVYVDLPDHPVIADSELLKAHGILASHFPNADIDLLYVGYQDGISFEDRMERNVGPSITSIVFDCRDRGPNALPLGIDYRRLAELLFSKTKVVDYRSADEKRAFAEKKRRERYARFAASTPFQLFVNRLQYKIWRFFARRLARKGIDCRV